MSSTKHYSFALLWLVVIGVSVHDGYLVMVHREAMTTMERNPVGRLLLRWNGGDIWLLLAAKALGTVCAAALLLVLYWTRRRLAGIACAAIATGQLVLLTFLYLA